MSVYRLSSELCFPSPELAEENGLLAIGGDLSPERLLLAYSLGIFPWYNAGEPILWWSPMPRCVLLPGDFQASRSLSKLMRSDRFHITCDHDFASVIRSCASCGDRLLQGTWISPAMIAAYEHLFALGFAHSLEVWCEDELVGGLYGIMLGKCFFGESMFHTRRDASKVALYALHNILFAQQFVMIDMQLPTPHLLSLGGRLVDRHGFNHCLALADVFPSNLKIRPSAPFHRCAMRSSSLV